MDQKQSLETTKKEETKKEARRVVDLFWKVSKEKPEVIKEVKRILIK